MCKYVHTSTFMYIYLYAPHICYQSNLQKVNSRMLYLPQFMSPTLISLLVCFHISDYKK